MNRLAVASSLFLIIVGSMVVPTQNRGAVRGPLEQSRTHSEGIWAQPLNSIRVEVRYRKEYGYKYDAGAYRGVGATSCPAFAVFARPNNAVRLRKPIPIAADARMASAGSHYVCYFLVTELPRNVPILVRGSLTEYRQLPTEPWKGGSLAQPPAGQQRMIANDSRNVTLSEREPRAALIFEMVYGPSVQSRR